MIHVHFNQANKRVEDKESYGGISLILKCDPEDLDGSFEDKIRKYLSLELVHVNAEVSYA